MGERMPGWLIGLTIVVLCTLVASGPGAQRRQRTQHYPPEACVKVEGPCGPAR